MENIKTRTEFEIVKKHRYNNGRKPELSKLFIEARVHTDQNGQKQYSR